MDSPFPAQKLMLPTCTDPHEVILVVKGPLPRINLNNDFTHANMLEWKQDGERERRRSLVTAMPIDS